MSKEISFSVPDKSDVTDLTESLKQKFGGGMTSIAKKKRQMKVNMFIKGLTSGRKELRYATAETIIQYLQGQEARARFNNLSEHHQDIAITRMLEQFQSNQEGK